MRNLTLAACVFLMAGCAETPRAIPAVAPCDAPQIIPGGGLTGKRAAILWSRDREALRICRGRLDLVIK
jgi:hypothetical protein